MRKVVMGLVVVVVVAVAADFATRLVVEKTVENQLLARSDLRGENIEVSFGDFPFTLSLLDRRFHEVTVTSQHVPDNGIELESVVMHLRDVRIEDRRVEVRGGEERRLIQVHSGSGAATISLEELERVVQANGYDVELAGTDGALTVSCRRAAALVCEDSVEATIGIQPDDEASRLVIQAPAPIGSIDLALPEPVDGVRFESASVRAGELSISLRLRDIDFFL